MTITDAVIKVLENEDEGLTLQQIYDKIIENNYYEFGAKKPLDALRVQIMRYCEDKTISFASDKKAFISEQKDGTEIFLLKYRRGQVMDENKKYKYFHRNKWNNYLYSYNECKRSGKYQLCGSERKGY